MVLTWVAHAWACSRWRSRGAGSWLTETLHLRASFLALGCVHLAPAQPQFLARFAHWIPFLFGVLQLAHFRSELLRHLGPLLDNSSGSLHRGFHLMCGRVPSNGVCGSAWQTHTVVRSQFNGPHAFGLGTKLRNQTTIHCGSLRYVARGVREELLACVAPCACEACSKRQPKSAPNRAAWCAWLASVSRSARCLEGEDPKGASVLHSPQLL